MAGDHARPSPEVVRTYDMPKPVIREAYSQNPASRRYVVDSLRKVRELCVELGIVTPLSKQIWRAFGIWG